MKFVSLLLIGFLSTAFAADWAVIIAGSKTYSNYRHQADACHAYHLVKKFGIPDSRVIVMVYDDIASSSKNPVRGKVFNKPTKQGTPGVDVYAGCKKDYTGDKVTGANFVKVLTGDTSAPGPVLKSTADDRVFINFADHGGTGIIAMPSGGSLHADTLNEALKKMHSKKMYKKLVFYLEACESGSMFENKLPKNINIYATTAANARESSMGCYCPPNDVVNGVHIKSCLGDTYSVNWMENADEVGKDETLQAQYEIVKKKTTRSHVMQYGDTSFTSDTIGMYMGDDTSVNSTTQEGARKPEGEVSSRDIPLHLAYYNYLGADTSDFETRQALAKEFIDEIRLRQEADLLFYTLAKEIASEEKFFQPANLSPGKCPCCVKVHDAMYNKCGGYNDYSLQYARVMVNLCEVSTATAIIEKLEELC